MLKNYEYTYEIRAGKAVFVQNRDASVRADRYIGRIKRRYTPNPIFFHFERRGGHLEALRTHFGSSFFSRFDIEGFFGKVSRAKIVRALKAIGIRDREAFDTASDSVVVVGHRKVLPYGFKQSPLIATLVLERSLLGRSLIGLPANIKVSVYVDDIVLSSSSQSDLRGASEQIALSANMCGFALSLEKMQTAELCVTAFNCNVSATGHCLEAARIERFASQHLSGSVHAKTAIERYVEAVHSGDLARLRDELARRI